MPAPTPPVHVEPYDAEGITAELTARNGGKPLNAETLAKIATNKAASDAAIAALAAPQEQPP